MNEDACERLQNLMRVSATAKCELEKDPEVRKTGQERAWWTEEELMLNTL